MTRTRIRTSLASLAAAALLVTAGCGVDQSDSATEKVTGNTDGKIESPGGNVEIESGSFEGTGGAVFLNQAAEATSAVDTQKIWLEMEVTGVPEMGSMSITAEGAIDNKAGVSHMKMDMGSMFAGLDEMGDGSVDLPDDMGVMEMIVDGDTSYVKSSLFSMVGEDSKPWMKMDTEEQGSVTNGTPSDPSKFLDYLKSTGSEIEELGTEEVRGVETVHIRTVLDTEEVMANAAEDDLDDMQAQLDELGGSFPEIPVEAWVGDDDMVRRLTMSFDFDQLAEEELDGAGMTITIEMYD